MQLWDHKTRPFYLKLPFLPPLNYCGGTLPSLLLDGAGGFLSFLLEELLSPLNAPTILPKRLFFFLASSSAAPVDDWTPEAGCKFPLVEGGGSAVSEFPPNMREKKPRTPPLWSQVS